MDSNPQTHALSKDTLAGTVILKSMPLVMTVIFKRHTFSKDTFSRDSNPQNIPLVRTHLVGDSNPQNTPLVRTPLIETVILKAHP